MCHQVLDKQRFKKDPSLAHLASRDDTSAGASHERLRVDVEQRGCRYHVEGSGVHLPALVAALRLIEE